jgi:toxin-antitoxin system PIN domain toxin
VDLADINVWLALAYDGHVHHARAQAWFDAVGVRGAAFCRITQLGLLRLATNDKVMGDEVLTQRQAWVMYDGLCGDERVAFLEEPPDIGPVWRQFTQSTYPSTKSWTDAYLAAFASSHALRLVSLDKGFAKFPNLQKLILLP